MNREEFSAALKGTITNVGATDPVTGTDLRRFTDALADAIFPEPLRPQTGDEAPKRPGLEPPPAADGSPSLAEGGPAVTEDGGVSLSE